MKRIAIVLTSIVVALVGIGCTLEDQTPPPTPTAAAPLEQSVVAICAGTGLWTANFSDDLPEATVAIDPHSGEMGLTTGRGEVRFYTNCQSGMRLAGVPEEEAWVDLTAKRVIECARRSDDEDGSGLGDLEEAAVTVAYLMYADGTGGLYIVTREPFNKQAKRVYTDCTSRQR